ncbi:hypothetical protein GA0115254_109330 [Streptomyces sp. Ncost-T10-10d]|nr:hypothetical protein GA0115254_109330 [Streptomyces sp. Ncost-T10-10d]
MAMPTPSARGGSGGGRSHHAYGTRAVQRSAAVWTETCPTRTLRTRADTVRRVDRPTGLVHLLRSDEGVVEGVRYDAKTDRQMGGGRRSGAGCVQLQGGGLRQMGSPLLERSRELGEGAMVIDDNAADARAQPRDAAPHLPVGPSVTFTDKEMEDVRQSAAAEGKSLQQYLHDLREMQRKQFVAVATGGCRVHLHLPEAPHPAMIPEQWDGIHAPTSRSCCPAARSAVPACPWHECLPTEASARSPRPSWVNRPSATRTHDRCRVGSNGGAASGDYRAARAVGSWWTAATFRFHNASRWRTSGVTVNRSQVWARRPGSAAAASSCSAVAGHRHTVRSAT